MRMKGGVTSTALTHSVQLISQPVEMFSLHWCGVPVMTWTSPKRHANSWLWCQNMHQRWRHCAVISLYACPNPEDLDMRWHLDMQKKWRKKMDSYTILSEHYSHIKEYLMHCRVRHHTKKIVTQFFDRHMDSHTTPPHAHGGTQAMTIPEGHNWPRVKTRHFRFWFKMWLFLFPKQGPIWPNFFFQSSFKFNGNLVLT